MSAQYGASGAWDGGPPGAETDYSHKPQPAPSNQAQWSTAYPSYTPTPYLPNTYPTQYPTPVAQDGALKYLSSFPNETYHIASPHSDYLPPKNTDSYRQNYANRSSNQLDYEGSSQTDKRPYRDRYPRDKSRSRSPRRNYNSDRYNSQRRVSRRSRSRSFSKEKRPAYFRRSKSPSLERRSVVSSPVKAKSRKSSSSSASSSSSSSDSSSESSSDSSGSSSKGRKEVIAKVSTPKPSVKATSESKTSPDRRYDKNKIAEKKDFKEHSKVRPKQEVKSNRDDRKTRRYSKSRSRSPVPRRNYDNRRQRRRNSKSRSRSRSRNRASGNTDLPDRPNISRRDDQRNIKREPFKREAIPKPELVKPKDEVPDFYDNFESFDFDKANEPERKTKSQPNKAPPKVETLPAVKDEKEIKSEEMPVEESMPVFKNDGSFLEMFKKMQEKQNKPAAASTSATNPLEIKKPALPFIGKRRGGRVLKTGMVKKAKTIEEHTVDDAPKDAWSLYLREVKQYRDASCEEEGKTRPLVK